MFFVFVLKLKDDLIYVVRYKEFFLDIIDFCKKKELSMYKNILNFIFKKYVIFFY